MKIKLFDVVELNSGNNATILGINKGNFKAEIIDKEGNSLGFKEITNLDIKEVIFTKQNKSNLSL